MTVSTWPAYLLKRVPEELRLALSAEAEERDYSLADLIREILCTRYELDCERRRNPNRGQPIGYGEHGNRDQGSSVLLVRLQPELWEKIKETAEDGRPIRQVVLDILEEHYDRVRDSG